MSIYTTFTICYNDYLKQEYDIDKLRKKLAQRLANELRIPLAVVEVAVCKATAKWDSWSPEGDYADLFIQVPEEDY